MPRRKLIRQSQYPYHVTIRSNDKRTFPLRPEIMWELCYECLLYAKANCPVEINCFVLMKNHYHLLVTTPNSNLDSFMYFFNRKLSLEISKRASSINHRFANRYHWTIVDDITYLFNIYRYIYQNPVRAGQAELCIDYPYSSLRYSPREKRTLSIKVHLDYFKHRPWMETHNGCDFDKIIRTGLRRQTFGIANRVRGYFSQKQKLIKPKQRKKRTK